MALVWPTTQALRKITATKLENLLAADPISEILPLRAEDTHFLEWEVEDNTYGMTQARGLDGPPARVNKVGAKRFIEEPGVYGEFMIVNEAEMTVLQRQIGTVNERETMDMLADRYTTQLAQRWLRRYKYIAWTLLTTGTYSVTGPNGQVLHSGTYSIPGRTGSLITVSVLWTAANAATAHPLADLGDQITNGPANGTNFAGGPNGATLYLNDAAFRAMMKNTNAADLGGRRLTGLQPVNGRMALNEILTADGLPNIVVFDEWYNNDSDVVTRFIPDNKAILVGRRLNGETLGEFAQTFNANNPGGASGPYSFVKDTRGVMVPPSIEFHYGCNGGPIMWYPGAVRILTIA